MAAMVTAVRVPGWIERRLRLGRWIGSAAAAAGVLGEPVPDLVSVANALLGRQLPDGSFSAKRTPETWWGASRALEGLRVYLGAPLLTAGAIVGSPRRVSHHRVLDEQGPGLLVYLEG
jgi:hypothetical protein